MIKEGKVYSALLADEEKSNLTEWDIYDRVVNLKFYSRTGETYVIRSDFEVVDNNFDLSNVFKPIDPRFEQQKELEISRYGGKDGQEAEKRQLNLAKQEAKYSRKLGSYYIRKCRMKPSIKVQYKRVTRATNIEFDIYINNFYMFDSTGQVMSSFGLKDNPITKIEVTMGYFGQFAAQYGGGVPTDFEDWKNLRDTFGVSKVRLNIGYVTTDKLPPDSVLHIHAYVGAGYHATVEEMKADLESTGKAGYDFSNSKFTYQDFIGSPSITIIDNKEKPQSSSNRAGKNVINDLFYTHITKRFPRNPEADIGKISLVKGKVDSCMTDEEAEKYGIKVICSDGVWDSSLSVSPKKDADGNPVYSEFFFNSGETADRVFSRINAAVGNCLMKTTLNDNNWWVYTDKEAKEIDKLASKFPSGEKVNYFFNNTLPAVSSISTQGPMATIVAPFFFFIDPFQIVHFKSRYVLSNLVSYYAATDPRQASFRVINQLVSFATVDNVNEMTLTCVAANEEAPNV